MSAIRTKPEKTPEIRARELFKMVYGRPFPPTLEGTPVWKGFLKLGKFVLALEKKWAKAKGRKK